MRHAVIIAAGLGSRLAPAFTVPKPLVPIGGCPLLFWALYGAEQAGCREAVVVVGYRAAEIQDALRAGYRGRLTVRVVYDPAFIRQNGLSVLAARPYVESPFLLLMADHFVEPAAMASLRTLSPPEQGALLVVDPRLERIVDVEDATKVLVHEGRVVDIGKQLTSYNAVDTGIFVATLELMDAIAHVAESRGDASLTDGVRELAQVGRMWAAPLGDYFWQDVDSWQTYEAAQRWVQEHPTACRVEPLP